MVNSGGGGGGRGVPKYRTVFTKEAKRQGGPTHSGVGMCRNAMAFWGVLRPAAFCISAAFVRYQLICDWYTQSYLHFVQKQTAWVKTKSLQPRQVRAQKHKRAEGEGQQRTSHEVPQIIRTRLCRAGVNNRRYPASKSQRRFPRNLTLDRQKPQATGTQKW